MGDFIKGRSGTIIPGDFREHRMTGKVNDFWRLRFNGTGDLHKLAEGVMEVTKSY